MTFGRAALVVSVWSGLVLAACGGGSGAGAGRPVAPAAGGASASASGASGGASSAPAPVPATAPQPQSSAKTAADHHRDFMGGCAKRSINSPDYCECAWGEFRKAFTDEEMGAGDMPAAKLDKVKAQVTGACGSKIPEDAVKEGFAKSCLAKKPEMKAYCDCTWSEFRKRFSVAELADEGTVTSERFAAARTPVVKTCGNKMPESVSKDAFMNGCAKDAASADFCGCAWKELRKQASPGEIESGTFDQKTIFASVEKSCGKLRPGKP